MAGMAEAIDGMAGMKLGPGAAGKGGAAAAPSKACNLAGSALDLEAIRSDNKRELLELLDGVSGRKALVLDAVLGQRLNHVLSEGASSLRDHGVAYFRELRPELGTFDGEAPEHVVYLARCTAAPMLTIAGHVKAALRRGEIGEASVDAPRAPKFHVFMVPRTTLLCKQILEDELVLPYVTIQAYHLDFVCFDKDVLSLECDHCFCDWNVHGDPTTLEFALAALLRLEQFFGAPRRIQAFGEAGKLSAKTHDRGLEARADAAAERGYFGTPTSRPSEGGEPPAKPGAETTVAALNSNDALYAEVRDLNIEKLGVHLRTRAKEIKAIQEEFRANKDASITEIHDFVKRIPGLSQNYNSVKTHVNVTEVVNKTTHGHDFRGAGTWSGRCSRATRSTIEDRIAQQEPPMATLRLLCLQSLCGGGIKGQAKYDFLRREVLQTYGFELIGTLYQLEKAGLLSKAKEGTVATNLLLGGADGAGSFAQLRKALKLIVDDVDPHDPRDIAYVSRAAPPDATTGLKPVMVVFFVGGVTYAEIAALRFLSKRDDFFRRRRRDERLPVHAHRPV
ncbi:hypothetical protein JL720_14809 [Aureococcus anophagefferens]|nr:hypothetical protein JL720_14809 [Aureococcus anophagefferens]